MKKYPVICLSFPAWDGDYVKSTVKLMSALADFRKVLYVDYAYTWKDLLKGLIGKHNHIPWRRVLGIEDRIRHVVTGDNSICVLSLPPLIPLNWIPSYQLAQFIAEINALLIRRCLKKAMERLRIADPIVINALNPLYGIPLQGKIGEIATIYYCYDEIGAAKWISRHGTYAEIRYMPRVDAMITTSHTLRRAKKWYNPNCFRIPNGVDPQIFSATTLTQQYPDNSAKKPTVGYLGTVDNRLDAELLEKMIQQMPDLHFQFVGRVTLLSLYRRLDQYENVEFTGPKAPEDLGKFVQQFDVGIIPFVKNSFTDGIYPMKINEYLAMGIPVVATRFGDIADFEKIARICEDHIAFQQAVVEELMYNKPEEVSKRIAFTKRNTWHHRAKDLDKFLTELLDCTPGKSSELTISDYHIGQSIS